MTEDATSYIWDLLRKLPTDEAIASPSRLIKARGAPVTAFAVKGREVIDELISSLEEVPDDHWDWDKWLHHAFTSGAPIIGLRDGQSGIITGFTSIERQAFITSSPFSGMIDLELEITSVYVRSDMRSIGYGAALREAASAYLTSVIDRIAGIPHDTVAGFGLSCLSVTISSHPESHEGHVFATRLYTDVSDHLASLSETAWFGRAILIDETDPEDALSLT